MDASTGEVIDEPGFDPRILGVPGPVGIHRTARTDTLHVALVDAIAIARTLGGSNGAQLIVMRFEVAQFLR